jgi:uncharacterized protein YndB with AHSA1/START domain
MGDAARSRFGPRCRLAVVASFAGILLGASVAAAAEDTRLCKELQPLEPLLGQWVADGIFGQQQGGMRVRYAPALDGQVVKAWSYVREGDDQPEMLLYETVIRWHPGEKQIVFRSHSAKGPLYDGVMEIDGRVFKSRFTDFQPNKVAEWRQTVKLAEDGSSYAWEVFGQKDGEWTPMAAHTFERAQRKVRAAARAAEAKAVETTLHTEPVRQIECETVVDASPAEVFAAWTTHAGVTSFFCADAKIELKVGGPYEIYFVPDAPAGERGSEGCHVLAYVPDEMIAFEWNAPPSIPTVRNGKHKAHVVIRMTDAGNGQTRVNARHLGFGEGADWDKTYAYFSKAWPTVMSWLHAKYAEDES